jgi:transposase
MIVIGLDAHKQTDTAALVAGDTARELKTLTVSASDDGHERLLRVAREREDERLWAIEDCRHVSGALERFLLQRGERVVRVPPSLMADSRRAVREPGKSDSIDALAIARAAIREPDLPVAQLAGPERDIALLLDHREHLVRESVRVCARLRWQLHDLDPALEPPARSLGSVRVLKRLSARLGRCEPSVQVWLCRELVQSLLTLRAQIKDLERALRPLVRRHAAPLLSLPGCGVLTAARLLSEIADVRRFSSDAQLARYAGVAPLDASSGRQQRHRLNRTGNRKLNAALHIIAITQARMHLGARAYLARRADEGKSSKEALRSLKRLIVRAVFRLLRSAGSAAVVSVEAPAVMPCLP